MRCVAIWKDEVMPIYANKTDQLGDSTESGAAMGASTFDKGGASPGTITIDTAVAIATNCLTFVLICIIIWLLLRYGRRCRTARLEMKETAEADTNSRKTETNQLPGPNSFVPTIYHQSVGPSFQTGVWVTPPSTLESHQTDRTLPMALPRVAESCYIPAVSPHNMPREVLTQRPQEIGPHSPSTFRDTEDCQSVDEERVNRVILEVARRMGGVERTGMPPHYDDLH